MATTPKDSETTNEFRQDAKQEAARNLAELREHVAIAAEETKDWTFPEALEFTEDYLSRVGLTIPRGLKQMLSEARGNDDVKEPLQGEPIALASDTGAWGNLLVDKGFNLVVAAPKVGKSALLVHLFAQARAGASECLGKPIRKPWNKLIISGSDMNASQWGKLLLREGLAECIGDPNAPDAKFLPCDDVLIWDQQRPARMNEKGIKAMREKCLEHPDSLLIIDSLRSNIDPSIDENKAEVRGPIEKTKEGLGDCEVTVALVHHANKSVSGSTAVNAAAGSNAIAGACDGTLLMKYLVPDNAVADLRGDWRVLAISSGRLQNDRAMVELTRDGLGRWLHHEDIEFAAKEQAVYEAEERLGGRQLQIYEHACEIAENGVHMTTNEAMSQLNLTRTKSQKAIDALIRKGLMVLCGVLDPEDQLNGGRPMKLYAPTTSDLARAKREKKGGFISFSSSLTDKTPTTPQNPSLCDPRVRARVREEFQPGTVVEREDALGQWVVTCSADPEKIRVEKLGNSSLVARLSHTLLRPAQPFTPDDNTQQDYSEVPTADLWPDL